MNNFNIILASNSQRRKELLKFIFNEFKVIPANIDERTLERKFLSKTTKDDKSKYSELCDILSLEKCKKVAKDYKSSLIVSADTIVYDDGTYKNKYEMYLEAMRRLRIDNPVLIFEDSINGVLAAKKANAKVIAIASDSLEAHELPFLSATIQDFQGIIELLETLPE